MNSLTDTHGFACPENGTSINAQSLVPPAPPFRGDRRERPSDGANVRQPEDYRRWSIRTAQEHAGKDGPALARRWAAAPIMDLSGIVGAIGAEAAPVPGMLRYAPFDEIAILLPDGFSAYLRKGTGGPPPYGTINGNPILEPFSFYVSQTSSTGTSIRTFGYDDSVAMIGRWPSESLDQDITQTAVGVLRAIINSIAFISQCDSINPVLVEKTVRNRTAGEEKTNQIKPWLRRDVPHIILLDPLSAKQHGHGASRGGTHASPRIHQRRGHWHRLLHEKWRRNDDGTPRKVWVRQAWVGEREWEYQGNTYRVMLSAKTEVPS